VDLVALSAVAVLGDWDLELGAAGRLDGEESLLAETVADILVGDVSQLVVRDIVQDVFDALLGPLGNNKNSLAHHM